MSEKEVTETADELLGKGNADIEDASSIILNETAFNHKSLNNASFNIHHAVEKLIKGYLRYCGEIVYFGHDIEKYWKQAHDFNKTLDTIEDDVSYINQFGPIFEYSSKKQVTYENLEETLKGLKNIYFHPAIQKSLYFYAKDGLCETLPESLFDGMISNFQKIKQREEAKEILQFSLCSFDPYDDSVNICKGSFLTRIYKLEGLLPENAVKGASEKLVYENDGGKNAYFLRIRYKTEENGSYKADIYNVDIDFSEKQAESFIKKCRKQAEQKRQDLDCQKPPKR